MLLETWVAVMTSLSLYAHEQNFPRLARRRPLFFVCTIFSFFLRFNEDGANFPRFCLDSVSLSR